MEYRGSYEQANAFQSYWQDNPYPNFYNENPRDQPNFSWTSNDVLNHPFQPTHQEPYHSPGFQMPNFQQPQSYNSPQPQPSHDLSRLEALLTQSLAAQATFQQQTHAALKAREEKLNQLMLHQKVQETQLAQIAASSSMRQPENLPPQERQPYETVNAITLRSGTNYNIPKIPKDVEVEVLGKEFDVEIVDETDMEHKGPKQGITETEATIRSDIHENLPQGLTEPISDRISSSPIRIDFTRPNTTQDARILQEKAEIIDEPKPSSLPKKVWFESLTRDPLEALMYLDSCVDQIDNHSAVVDALEAALYGKELTTEQGEKVSELVHTSKAIEVMNFSLQSRTIEVKNTVLSEPHPLSLLILPNVYMHNSHLEKGHYSCIKGKHRLKSTMQAVAKKEGVPKKDGPSRGIKRCWDPGGFFDEVETVSGVWRRSFGSSFGGGNGRGTQDDYDDPGDALYSEVLRSCGTFINQHFSGGNPSFSFFFSLSLAFISFPFYFYVPTVLCGWCLCHIGDNVSFGLGESCIRI